LSEPPIEAALSLASKFRFPAPPRLNASQRGVFPHHQRELRQRSAIEADDMKTDNHLG
jgi:hypothetical protein